MSAGEINRYSTWELDTVVETYDPPFRFLLNNFFKRRKQFSGEFIEMDIVEGGRTVAPFVSPFQPGRNTRRNGYRTFQLKPAYIKLADTVRPTDGFTRTPGEPYGGSLTPMQRLDKQIVEQVMTHLDMIENRLELMASELLFTGKLVINDENYPRAVVDFERALANDATVTTVWSNNAATPLVDIQAHALTINKTARGAKVTDLVMTGAIFDKLMSFQSVRDLLNRDKNLSPGTSAIETGPRSGDRDATYRGIISGQYRLWTYDGYFETDTGTSKEIMDQERVLFLSDQSIEGTRYNGAILDMDAEMQAREVFVKERRLWDPSGHEVITQSAPMVGLRRPNGCGTLRVL